MLIDTGPDFRQQALRENLRTIDAVLYTHSHADHIMGLDDLRPLSFKNPDKIPLYADGTTTQVLQQVFEYTFSESNRLSIQSSRRASSAGGAHTSIWR